MSAGPVALFGPLPLPRHGVSAVNESVAAILRSRTRVVICDTSPRSLTRKIGARVFGLIRAGYAVFSAWNFFRCGGRAMYMSVSGGWRQVIESAMLAGCVPPDCRLVLHHHSFRYIERWFGASYLVIGSAPRATLHVALGERMLMGLVNRFSETSISHCVVMSNAILCGNPLQGRPRRALRVVGYLANISVEKGLFDVLELAAAAAADQLDIKFVIAGPFESADVEECFHARASTMLNIEYLGPIYGPAKDAFFDSIDVFVFPTRYVNEAEPLVVLESLRAGVPVIAFDRGCLAEIVDSSSGLCVPRVESFCRPAMLQMSEWIEQPQVYAEISRGAARKFAALWVRSEVAIKVVEEFLLNAPIRERTVI